MSDSTPSDVTAGLLWFFFCIAATSGALTESPSDMAVVMGNNIRLNCSTDGSSTDISWQYNAMSSLPLRIVLNCEVNPDVASLYAVETTETGQCNLIILSSNMQSAGTYTCQNVFDQDSAVVVMLNSNATCSYSPTKVIDGTIIRIMCELHYNGTQSPKMAWSVEDTGSAIKNATTSTYPTVVNSYIDVPVYAPTSRPFTCTVYFDPNIDFRYVWTLPTIYVEYELRSVLTKTTVKYFENTLLTCLADGYPAPNYIWINEVTGVIVVNQSIELPSYGFHHYTCEASNRISSGVTTILRTGVQLDLSPVWPQDCPTTSTTSTTTPSPSPTTTEEPTTTTGEPIAECGRLLLVAPPGSISFPDPRWTPLCYITRNETELLETPCRDLIVDLPPGYATYSELLASGGNFGCTLTQSSGYEDAENACFDNYQTTAKLGQCVSCQRLYVCIRLPSAAAGRRHNLH